MSEADKPVRHVPGRGYNISGTGLFQGDDGLAMYPTKRAAAAFAKQHGWPAKYVVTVFSPLFGGYAVAQILHGVGVMRFLREDGAACVEAPLVNENMRNPRAEQ